MLVLEGLGVFIQSLNFSFFGISGWGIDLDYCDDEWFALEVNRDHSLIFETAPKYRILDSFVDYAAKSLQSCPTLCDPMDGSPPGYLIPGILQARTLEWVEIVSSLKILNLILHSILFYFLEIIIVHLFSYIENLIPNVINTIT